MNITKNQIHINLISKLILKLSEARQCTTKMHMSAIISNVSVISLKLCLCFSLSLHLCVSLCLCLFVFCVFCICVSLYFISQQVLTDLLSIMTVTNSRAPCEAKVMSLFLFSPYNKCSGISVTY